MAAGLPSAVLVEIEFTAGVWTDVSSLVVGDSIEIHVGRDSASSGIQPGTLDLDLDNADGRFTPDNPTSTYYPNFVEGKRVRVRVTKSATTYVRFVGRITSLEADFPTEPSQSRTHLAAVDVLGDFTRINPTTYIEALARQGTVGSTAYYPLTDANEHIGMFDVLDVGDPLTIYDRIPGTGKIEARSDESLGDGQAYVRLSSGKGLWHAGVGLPYSAGTRAYVYAVVKVTSSSYGEVLAVGNLRRDGIDQLVRVRWTSTGFLTETYTGGTLAGTSSASAASDGWHVILLGVGNISDSLGVDALGTVSSGVAFSGSPRFLSVGGDIDMSVAQLAVSTSLLDSGGGTPGIAEIVSPFQTRSVARYTTALFTAIQASGLQASALWTLDPLTVSATPASWLGEDALSALSAVANSQAGYAYAIPSTSATQSVGLVNNREARPGTVSLTIDAEGDLQGGPAMVRDITARAAAATATSATRTVTATDATITDTGAATLDVETVLANEPDLYAVASDRIARGRDSKIRPASLTIDLATASNDLYASFYALTLGERIRLSGLPATYFGVSFIDGYVEGYTERPGITGYEVTFDLSPADAPPEAKADDSTYARVPFGDGVCTVTGGTAVGTTATGTMILTFTGSDLLSTAAGDYPMDFDWNGERVTVTSAPAGGSSPRTLTITARGVAPTVARVHSAGERIDLWLGASVAL